MSANLVEVITPMPDSSASLRASAALARVQALLIRAPEDYVAAAGYLADIKGQYKSVDADREELKAPSLEACRRVENFFKPPLTFLKQAETILKGKLTDYDREQERIRAEEQRRLDDIARREREKKEAEAREVARKAREAADTARREADTKRQAQEKATRDAEEARKRGDAAAAAEADKAAQVAAKEAARFDSKADRVESAAVEKVADIQSQAACVVAPIIQRAPPKVAGLSFREVAQFEIVDKSLLPEEYKMADEVRIGKVVKALKMDARIPGVRVWMAKQPASGSGVG